MDDRLRFLLVSITNFWCFIIKCLPNDYLSAVFAPIKKSLDDLFNVYPSLVKPLFYYFSNGDTSTLASIILTLKVALFSLVFVTLYLIALGSSSKHIVITYVHLTPPKRQPPAFGRRLSDEDLFALSELQREFALKFGEYPELFNWHLDRVLYFYVDELKQRALDKEAATSVVNDTIIIRSIEIFGIDLASISTLLDTHFNYYYSSTFFNFPATITMQRLVELHQHFVYSLAAVITVVCMGLAFQFVYTFYRSLVIVPSVISWPNYPTEYFQKRLNDPCPLVRASLLLEYYDLCEVRRAHVPFKIKLASSGLIEVLNKLLLSRLCLRFNAVASADVLTHYTVETHVDDHASLNFVRGYSTIHRIAHYRYSNLTASCSYVELARLSRPHLYYQLSPSVTYSDISHSELVPVFRDGALFYVLDRKFVPEWRHGIHKFKYSRMLLATPVKDSDWFQYWSDASAADLVNSLPAAVFKNCSAIPKSLLPLYYVSSSSSAVPFHLRVYRHVVLRPFLFFYYRIYDGVRDLYYSQTIQKRWTEFKTRFVDLKFLKMPYYSCWQLSQAHFNTLSTNFNFFYDIFYTSLYLCEHYWLEFFWTVIPFCDVLVLLVPTVREIYAEHRRHQEYLHLNIKVLGHQWYWSFHWLADYSNILTSPSFDFDTTIFEEVLKVAPEPDLETVLELPTPSFQVQTNDFDAIFSYFASISDVFPSTSNSRDGPHLLNPDTPAWSVYDAFLDHYIRYVMSFFFMNRLPDLDDAAILEGLALIKKAPTVRLRENCETERLFLEEFLSYTSKHMSHEDVCELLTHMDHAYLVLSYLFSEYTSLDVSEVFSGCPSALSLFKRPVDVSTEASLYNDVFAAPFIANQDFSDVTLYNAFDMYMINPDSLIAGDIRYLSVDHPLIIPVNQPVRFVVTSLDVLHSFAIPALGIKIDACPGRLNQVHSLVRHAGTFYGQCSELCGVGHGFMPITIYAIDPSWFHSDSDISSLLFSFLATKE